MIHTILLKKNYDCNKEVFDFIYEKNLFGILIEAPNIIKNHFNNFELKLELKDDYEDDTKILFLIIKSKTIKQSIKNLSELFKEWKLESHNKYITITMKTK